MNLDRKRVRCGACRLVQFGRAVKTCVRCGESYGPKPVVIAKPVAEVPFKPIVGGVEGKVADFSFWLSFVFTELRRRAGLTQAALARILGCPRTYVNKVELDKCVPLISAHGNFARYCAAVNSNPWQVIRMTEFLVNGQ